jgi:hypothetical protein
MIWVGVVGEAARKTGRGMTRADSTRQIFEILSLGLDDIDIAIVDICANIHSLAILEALTYSQAAPPVIALVEVDEPEAKPIVQRHGAAGLSGKAFRRGRACHVDRRFAHLPAGTNR